MCLLGHCLAMLCKLPPFQWYNRINRDEGSGRLSYGSFQSWMYLVAYIGSGISELNAMSREVFCIQGSLYSTRFFCGGWKEQAHWMMCIDLDHLSLVSNGKH